MLMSWGTLSMHIDFCLGPNHSVMVKDASNFALANGAAVPPLASRPPT